MPRGGDCCAAKCSQVSMKFNTFRAQNRCSGRVSALHKKAFLTKRRKDPSLGLVACHLVMMPQGRAYEACRL